MSRESPEHFSLGRVQLKVDFDTSWLGSIISIWWTANSVDPHDINKYIRRPIDCSWVLCIWLNLSFVESWHCYVLNVELTGILYCGFSLIFRPLIKITNELQI